LKLKAGDPAPDFSAATNGGGKVSLTDLRGKEVVLYFYPRDDTPRSDIVDWLDALEITVIWREKKAFLDNANGQFT